MSIYFIIISSTSHKFPATNWVVSFTSELRRFRFVPLKCPAPSVRPTEKPLASAFVPMGPTQHDVPLHPIAVENPEKQLEDVEPHVEIVITSPSNRIRFESEVEFWNLFFFENWSIFDACSSVKRLTFGWNQHKHVLPNAAKWFKWPRWPGDPSGEIQTLSNLPRFAASAMDAVARRSACMSRSTKSCFRTCVFLGLSWWIWGYEDHGETREVKYMISRFSSDCVFHPFLPVPSITRRARDSQSLQGSNSGFTRVGQPPHSTMLQCWFPSLYVFSEMQKCNLWVDMSPRHELSIFPSTSTCFLHRCVSYQPLLCFLIRIISEPPDSWSQRFGLTHVMDGCETQVRTWNPNPYGGDSLAWCRRKKAYETWMNSTSNVKFLPKRQETLLETTPPCFVSGSCRK